MTAMLLRLQPYYTVKQAPDGRWLVVHSLPGQPGSYGVDDDCPTERAAEQSAAWLERARDDEVRRMDWLPWHVLQSEGMQ